MMVDMRCPRCHRHIGWSGEIIDAPRCPRCRYRVPAERLERDQAEIERFREFLAARAKAKGGAP